LRWAAYLGVAAASPWLILIGSQTRVLWPLPQLLGHCAWTLFNLAVGTGILWAIAARPRVLNHWLLVWVGTISYSLYIWHMPFMNPATQIPFPLNLVMALLAAVASCYLLEAPMLHLGKSFRVQGRRGQGRAGRVTNSQAVMLPTAPEN
jgi:peptidoglycan/LPS O-acetylase OafA/YrhL